MPMATDPVCGMQVDEDNTVATAEHNGVTYSFCSQACLNAFEDDPELYAAEAA